MALLAMQAMPLNGQDPHTAGRALLAQLFYAQTGQPMPRLCVTPRGKPYFPDDPIHFSISHCATHVFCVLSTVPVGIDAECLTRQVKPALAKKILSPGEYAQYLEAKDPNLALLTFWVLKEAAVKCSGEGLQGYPSHTNFSLSDPRVRQIDGCVVAIIEE